MAKMTPFEAKQLVAEYIAFETRNKTLNPPEKGYVPSIVREQLERIDFNHPTDRQLCYLRAVKQCLSERGIRFERMFRTLHQIFYLLERGYTYETAKKKARLVNEDREHAAFWAGHVRPEHVPVLKAA